MGVRVKAGYENGAMLTTYLFRYTPFRSQIFKIFFASGGKGHIDPLTKILRTPLTVPIRRRCVSGMRDVVA